VVLLLPPLALVPVVFVKQSTLLMALTFGGGFSRTDVISIQGGTIKATGANGADIGSRHSNAEDGMTVSSTVGSITITDGNINAKSTEGAGIESGYAFAINDGTVKSIVNSLAITGGTVSGTTSHGAGIGSSEGYGNGMSTVNNVSIINGRVSGFASSRAGIESDQGSAVPCGRGESNVMLLGIMNGIIAETGGAGIGAGDGVGPWSNGMSSVEGIEISGGKIRANGTTGAGIGNANVSELNYGIGKSLFESVSFAGEVDLTVDGDGSHRAVNGLGIQFSEGTVRALTTSLPLLGSQPTTFTESDIAFLDKKVTSDGTVRGIGELFASGGYQ
jgi:hypothetical protein